MSLTAVAKRAVKWIGFSLERLEPSWKLAVETYTKTGGAAEGRLGEISAVEIKAKGDNPVHQSRLNLKDKEEVISARIKGLYDTKTCHIYKDGTGTTKKGAYRY